jgi:predicted GNAT family N-acyltransferase
MDAAPPFRILRAGTAQHMALVRAIRQQVFIDEQGIPAELEWDERDSGCIHILAFSPAGEAVGTGRLDIDGRIGRMAVLASWRGCGAGTAMLDALLALARETDCRRVYLHAQESAQSLYRRAGFRTLGKPYLEAGIRHISMEMCLDDGNT